MKKSNDLPRVCKKCMIPEFSGDAEAFLDVYIRQIDEQLRTEEVLYEERLGICADCCHLANGVCRLCGCLTLVRAAVKKNACPDVPKKW